MRKIVVASHSLLAQGFKDTLEFLTGKSDAVNAVCAYVNDNGEGLERGGRGRLFRALTRSSSSPTRSAAA